MTRIVFHLVACTRQHSNDVKWDHCSGIFSLFYNLCAITFIFHVIGLALFLYVKANSDFCCELNAEGLNGLKLITSKKGDGFVCKSVTRLGLVPLQFLSNKFRHQ